MADWCVNFNELFGCPSNHFDATSFILSDKMTKQLARLSIMGLDSFLKENSYFNWTENCLCYLVGKYKRLTEGQDHQKCKETSYQTKERRKTA